jgi:hypothetical protein
MSRYESRDVSFDVPRHWDDRTLVAFAAPAKPGQATAPNVVLTRDTLGPEETIQSYADKQLAELSKRLEGFGLDERKELTFGGQPGVELRFSWQGSAGKLEQRLAMAVGKRRTVFCFNATMAKADADQMNPLFDRIMSTIRFPRPGETT